MSDAEVLRLNTELITNTPSRKHDISPQEEALMRNFGCELIQHAVIQLLLSTATCGTAQILFHRFYFRQSMRKYSVERMAPACVYLAAKVEEQPQPISNVLEVFHYMRCARMDKPHISFIELPDSVIGEKRADLTKMESLLLTQLGFIIHTELPYKFLCAYLDFLGLSANHELAQRAWNYSNDIFRSDACVRYEAPVLACACIHLAASDLSVSLPCEPPWWLVFNVSDAQISCITAILQQMLCMPAAFNVLEPAPSKGVMSAPVSSQVLHPQHCIDAASTCSDSANDFPRECSHPQKCIQDSDRDERRRARAESNDAASVDDRGSSHRERREDRSDFRVRGLNDRKEYIEERYDGVVDRRRDTSDERDFRGHGNHDKSRNGDEDHRIDRVCSREERRKVDHEAKRSRSSDRSASCSDVSGRNDHRAPATSHNGQHSDRHPAKGSDFSLVDDQDRKNIDKSRISGYLDSDIKLCKRGARAGRWDES
jgi:hypothetical protein